MQKRLDISIDEKIAMEMREESLKRYGNSRSRSRMIEELWRDRREPIDNKELAKQQQQSRKPPKRRSKNPKPSDPQPQQAQAIEGFRKLTQEENDALDARLAEVRREVKAECDAMKVSRVCSLRGHVTIDCKTCGYYWDHLRNFEAKMCPVCGSKEIKVRE